MNNQTLIFKITENSVNFSKIYFHFYELDQETMKFHFLKER
jgi:hypothetical protein